MMLKVEGINVFYGQIQALFNVSLEVNDGEIVALIGANGAGKTTLLSTISGLNKSTTGHIIFDDVVISKIPTYKIVNLKMAHVPEGRQVFAGLSVEDNLILGAATIKDKDLIKKNIEKNYLIFPRLKERKNQLAGTLSGGEQQMLAIARALMINPKILLLDEPSMGLSPLLVKEVFHIIKEINKSGVTVLLVEQNAKMALSIANRGYVIETGRITLEGKGSDLLNDDKVKKAYLGA